MSLNNAVKAGIIVGGIILVIAVYLGLNVYAISNLQFRGSNVNEINFANFDMADMSMDVELEVCNPTFIPASFNILKVDIIYKSTNMGTFIMFGKTVLPQSSSIVDGRLKSNALSMGGLFLEFLKASFTGTKPNVDPNELHYVTTLDAPILGVIPFSISKSYAPTKFWDMIRGQTGNYSC